MGSSSTESRQFAGISATTGAFTLKGGRYSLVVTATFGGGNVQLQTLALDGSTWITLGSAITAAGNQTYDLPPASYRLGITTATAVYASLTNVPT
jgi:hypothetical protein